MNKRGFTLIELLAVIVILAIILLIAIPKVLQIINDSKAASKKDNITLYGKAIENAVANYYMNNPEAKGVTLQELENGNYIQYKGSKIECDETTIWNRQVYIGKCKIAGKRTNYTYGEYIPVPELGKTSPTSTNGLTPVVYRNNNWVVVDKEDNDWYDYNEQKWANAVVLKSDVTKNPGDTVKVDGTEAVMMYVWIPRFEYNYKKLETELTEEEKLTPPGIDINFISKETTTLSSSNYKVHPAFEFDGSKSGMWVGKFELSSVGANLTTDNNLGCSSTITEGCTNNITNLRILPNVPSLRYNDVSNFFYAIKGISTSFGLSNIDTHMMKNSEWGALAYLSQSKYGKYGNNDYEGTQKEVYINNSSNFITGRSGGAPGGNTPQNGTYSENTTSIQQYIGYGYYTYDGYLLNYDTNNKSTTRDINKGTGASTTGNIYGIYDMSGGSWEYVMGAYAQDGYPTIINSGFSSDPNVFTNGTIDSKYYDIYKTSTANTACGENEVCYGHGLSETSGWNGDYADMVTSSDSWIVRGGTANDNYAAGLFGFRDANGTRGSNSSARVVGFAK